MDVKLRVVNPLVDVRLGPAGGDHSMLTLPLDTDHKFHQCLRQACENNIDWLKRVLTFASHQLKSHLVACKHAGVSEGAHKDLP